jgi:acyl-CoA synthetase (AMP-forming)/AMP-acid ligase II
MRFVQYTSNIASSDAYDEKANVFMGKFHNITDIVMWRSMIQPDEAAFVELDSRGKEQRTISFKKFNQRVTGYAMYLEKKCSLKAGDHVILWFSQDLDYVVTLHACWVLGLIPIPLQLPDHPHTNAHQSGVTLAGLGAAMNGPTITGSNATINVASAAANRIIEEKKSAVLTALFCILDEIKVKAILGNMATDDFLKQKTTGTSLRARRAAFSPLYVQTPEAFSTADIFLPAFHNVTKAPKNKQTLGALSGYAPRKEWFAASYPAVYLIDPEVRVGSVASRKLLKLNHETLNSLCRNQKLQFKAHSGQANIACMNIFNGLGFIRGCLSGIYNGGPTVLLQPADVYANPAVWIEAVARYKGRP